MWTLSFTQHIYEYNPGVQWVHLTEAVYILLVMSYIQEGGP